MNPIARFYGRPNKPTVKTISKHSRGPMRGLCRFNDTYTGLRKLMRAFRRRIIPDERVFKIAAAMREAHKRQRVYFSGHFIWQQHLKDAAFDQLVREAI